MIVVTHDNPETFPKLPYFILYPITFEFSIKILRSISWSWLFNKSPPQVTQYEHNQPHSCLYYPNMVMYAYADYMTMTQLSQRTPAF